MLLQNQQVGTQTALQDNLNNNTTVAATNSADQLPHLDASPAGAGDGSPASGEDHSPPPASSPGVSLGNDLNWVAETAAVITEASFLSNLGGSFLDSRAAPAFVTNGGSLQDLEPVSNTVTQSLVSSDLTEVGSVTLEGTSTVGTSVTNIPPPVTARPELEDTAQPSESSAGRAEPLKTDSSQGLALRGFLSQASEGHAQKDPTPLSPENMIS